jgi:hypothetical protein
MPARLAQQRDDRVYQFAWTGREGKKVVCVRVCRDLAMRLARPAGEDDDGQIRHGRLASKPSNKALVIRAFEVKIRHDEIVGLRGELPDRRIGVLCNVDLEAFIHEDAAINRLAVSISMGEQYVAFRHGALSTK